MMIWTKNGAIGQRNGHVILSEDCPCALCIPFDDMPDRYVDKHTSATEEEQDGLTLATAYASLQDAIIAFANCKINVKGYGESDPYDAFDEGRGVSGFGGPNLGSPLDCRYISGDGDSYLANNYIYDTSSIISYLRNSRIENIKFTSDTGIIYGRYCIRNLNSCEVLGCSHSPNQRIYALAFECTYTYFSDCVSDGAGTLANNGGGFGNCFYCELVDCEVIDPGLNGYAGVYFSTLTNCTVTNGAFSDCLMSEFYNCSSSANGIGFEDCSGIFVSCSVTNGNLVDYLTYGYEGGGGVYTSCTANNCYYCGFAVSIDSVFVSCSATNTKICIDEDDCDPPPNCQEDDF